MGEMLGNTEEKRRHAVAQRFEDLEVWQKSFELTAEVYEAWLRCGDEDFRGNEDVSKRREILDDRPNQEVIAVCLL